jgi:GNAT superfamily N-acetyltransferase
LGIRNIVSATATPIIRLAAIDEIVNLRWRILRAGLPRETADFDGDREPGTIHVGAFLSGTAENIACASFMRRPWQDQPAWQLRGMAVRDDYQGKGLGARMLAFAEQALRDRHHSNQLWCNARTPATHFYEKLGWQKFGEEFAVPTAGPHFKMTRQMRSDR